jgi:hypothetical protein
MHNVDAWQTCPSNIIAASFDASFAIPSNVSCVPGAQRCSVMQVSNDSGTKTTKETVELLQLTEKRPTLEN